MMEFFGGVICGLVVGFLAFLRLSTHLVVCTKLVLPKLIDFLEAKKECDDNRAN